MGDRKSVVRSTKQRADELRSLRAEVEGLRAEMRALAELGEILLRATDLQSALVLNDSSAQRHPRSRYEEPATARRRPGRLCIKIKTLSVQNFNSRVDTVQNFYGQVGIVAGRDVVRNAAAND